MAQKTILEELQCSSIDDTTSTQLIDSEAVFENEDLEEILTITIEDENNYFLDLKINSPISTHRKVSDDEDIILVKEKSS